jgi:DtxR family Mn-dependent transcriptional regulator
MLTRSEEDYLKAIQELCGRHGRASTSELAARLGVAPASITNMLQRLAAHQPPLVNYRKHRGATLTDDGCARALQVIRRHRLIELFLHRILDYGWDEVHEEAERLEHVISAEMEARIAQALGDPARDPHGEPIPTAGARMPEARGLALSDLRPGQAGVVLQVSGAPPALLRHLESLGLLPDTHVRALEYSPFDQNLRVQVEGQPQPITVGPQVAGSITVEVD